MHKIPIFLAFAGQLCTSFCAKKRKHLFGEILPITGCLLPFCCPVAPALAAQPANEVQAAQGKHVPKKATAKPAHKPVSKAVAKPLPKTGLDLSLPLEMVNNLEPNVGTLSPIQRRKPLLPLPYT